MIKRIIPFLTLFLFPIFISAQGYCDATGRTGTTTDIITNVKLYDINNTSAKSSYSDFTYLSTDLAIGKSFTIEVTLGNVFPLDTAGAWIDLNNNFEFEPSEQIVMSSFQDLKSTGLVTIPSTATPGPKRMRVRSIYTDVPLMEPCGEYFGEVEDYTVNLIEVNCTDVGSPCDDGKDCTMNDTIDENCNCRGTFEDMDQDGVCDEEDQCPGGNDNIDLNNNGTPDFCEDYCDAGGLDGTGADWISKIRLYNKVNSSIKSSYTDFTDLETVELVKGEEYDLHIHLNIVFPQDTAYAWIDFNQDFIFREDEMVMMSPFNSDRFSTGTITVPDDAILGNTRLRARVIWSQSAVSFTPCNDYYGEVEDYTVTIVDKNCPDEGNPCDDGKMCTTNDRIDANCNCIGIQTDSDFDGICDQDDECPGEDDNADLNDNGIADCKDYCLSAGSAATEDNYIINFMVGQIGNMSEKTTYSDFTDVEFTIMKGESEQMELQLQEAGQEDQALVWVDLNQDRIFDELEQMVMFSYENSVSIGVLSIPEDAMTGPTVIRVRNINGQFTDPCNVYGGEVEDYTLNILGTSSTTDFTNHKVYVNPSPASTQAFLQYDKIYDHGLVSISDMNGRKIFSTELSPRSQIIDVSTWQSGVYWMTFVSEDNRKTEVKKIVVIH